MAVYPPYVSAYLSLPKLFSGIQTAAVPPKVTQDFLATVLNLGTSSHRAYIPLLKKLGFIDGGNVPTQVYKDFRDPNQSGTIMADRLKEAYKSLFQANEYAWKLPKPELVAKLKNLTGAAEDDVYIPVVAATFTELSKLASWNGAAPPKKQTTDSTNGTGAGQERQEHGREELGNGGLRLGYTINLNLPATTEIEVFNAIFKSLRENLLTKL